MVKPEAADGTMLETAWESRWLPGLVNYRVTSVSIYYSKYLENCIQKEDKIKQISYVKTSEN